MEWKELNINWVITVLLWFFLWSFWAHRFFNGKIKSGVWMLLTFILWFVLLVVLIGFAILAWLWIWWLIDGIKILTWKFTDKDEKPIKVNNTIRDTQAVTQPTSESTNPQEETIELDQEKTEENITNTMHEPDVK